MTSKTSSDNAARTDLGERYPGWCTATRDVGDDGVIEGITRRKFDTNGAPPVTLEDEDNDGAIDLSAVAATRGDDGSDSAGGVDNPVDGAIDMEQPTASDSDGDEDQGDAYLRPHHTLLPEGRAVVEDGRGEVARHKLKRAADNPDVLEGPVAVHAFDARGRRTATFLFDFRGTADALPDASFIAQAARLDGEAGKWRWNSDMGDLAQVHLVSYDGNSNSVLAEALFEPSQGVDEIPTIDSIVDQVKTEAVHTRHKAGGAWSLSPAMPDAWRWDLRRLLLRETDSDGRIMRLRKYEHRNFQDVDSGGLLLAGAMDWTYDDKGNVLRRREDRLGPMATNRLGDGVYESATVSTYENGERVEQRMLVPNFAGTLPRSRVPREWRSVEFADSQPDDSVDVELLTVRQGTWRYGGSGNLLERRIERQAGEVRYEYRGEQLVGVVTEGLIRKRFGLYRRRLNGPADKHEQFQYDANGRRTKQISTTYDTLDMFQRDTTTMTYADGRLIREDILRYEERPFGQKEPEEPLARISYTYDDETGRLTHRSYEHLERKFRSYVDTFEYDAQGRRTRRTRQNTYRRNRPPEIVTFTYDEAGELVEKSTLEDGVVEQRVEYVYDDGRRVASRHFRLPRDAEDEETELELWYTAAYEHDDGRLVAERHHQPPTVYTYGYDCHVSNE
jgi:hypothetical protein